MKKQRPAKAENENSICFLDETEYLLSTKANKKALMDGVNQVKAGEKGKTFELTNL